MCRAIDAYGRRHAMAGIFDTVALLTRERQGLSYVEAAGTGENFLLRGRPVRAHEFHYSRLDPVPVSPYGYIVHRGTGLGQGSDGVMVRRSMGTWMHQHALASPAWAPAMVSAAEER